MSITSAVRHLPCHSVPGAVPRAVPRERRRHAEILPPALYNARARIEHDIGKLKRFERIALRRGKAAWNFAAFISRACTFIRVVSVRRA